MKASIWKNAWILGGVILLLFLFFDQHPVMLNWERSFYDWGVKAAGYIPLQDRITILAADDESVAALGRWPWSRNLHAKAIDLLAQGKPKLIVNTFHYLEPQTDPGQSHLIALKRFLDGSRLKKGLDEPKALLQYPSLAMDLQTMENMLTGALRDLDADQHLAQSLQKAGNVLLTMPFVLGRPQGRPSEDLPPYVMKNFLAHTQRPDAQAVYAKGATSPLDILGSAAAGIGHIHPALDPDGTVRSIPLAIDYYGAYFPSLALLAAAQSINIDSRNIVARPGLGVQVGRIWIQTDPRLRMYPFFYRDDYKEFAFQVDSFHDLLSGRILPQKYRDKIVLLGVTASGVTTHYNTSISPATPPVEILAHAISSILDENFFQVPEWSKPVRLVVYLLASLYIILLMPRLSAASAALISMLFVLSLAAVHFHLMVQSFLWLPLLGPMLMLICGYLVIVTVRFTTAEAQKMQADADSAESNRQLGLALQNQGMLDMAYERFLKCPDDPAMREILYNLGLDFERKRQFGKAATVYRRVAGLDKNYLDIQERLQRLQNLRDTGKVVVADGPSTIMGGALASSSAVNTLPVLGRYQIERELGRGAMGVVYLAKDPKINRTLAIKTISLLDCGDADDATEEVKRRFFQEAESAGRLNHPNIATIFDIGEEHDLAYIAMEYVEGGTLENHVSPMNLLPLPNVVEIIAKVAAALDFAHRKGVIHRDVKPGNVLYHPGQKLIKLTDFGIARIVGSQRTKTQTGMVVGTPQYMSPEQIAGKPLDGRADIFSLGVMSYQLLTGRFPFPAKEITTLIFQITHDMPPPMNLDEDWVIPECLEEIVLKAMAKDPEDRFTRGLEMAKAVAECGRSLVAR